MLYGFDQQQQVDIVVQELYNLSSDRQEPAAWDDLMVPWLKRAGLKLPTSRSPTRAVAATLAPVAENSLHSLSSGSTDLKSILTDLGECRQGEKATPCRSALAFFRFYRP